MGFFFRFLLQGKKNLKLSLLLFLTIACIGYLYIPISSLILKDTVKDNFFLQKFMPGVGLLIFGFFQFPAWPTLLTLTNEYFNLDTEGTAMGIWSANGDLGNIVGFGMCGLLVDSWQWRW
jgi:MFS family permease